MKNPKAPSDPDAPIHYRESPYGFEWGGCCVERVASHNGAVFLEISQRNPPGDRPQVLTIRVSPTGTRMRVFRRGCELEERTLAVTLPKLLREGSRRPRR